MIEVRLEARREGKPPRRFQVPSGRRAVIGRSPEADWTIEGDSRISRSHVEIWLEGRRLAVKRIPDSTNAVYCRGEEVFEFQLEPGEHFTIGKTRFFFLEGAPASTEPVEAAPTRQDTMSEKELYALGAVSDHIRLHDLLELPEILRAKSPEEFYVHIAGLMRSSTGALWSCIATEDGKVLSESRAGDVNLGLRMSRSLVQAALKASPRPTLYSWLNPHEDIKATAQEGVLWAVCAAAKVPGSQPILFYVAGSKGGEAAQKDNSRFVGLIADMVGRSLSVRLLENWQGRLQHYFSGPIVKKILDSPDMSALSPRLTQATVMFFDIRDFSKKTEEKNEQILAYQDDLRRVMTAMTATILKENGVVIQYQGDAILACWNLPFPDPAHVDRAAQAALRMVNTLSEMPGDWRCGIGLHTGEVVAGSIGSEQIWSYSVLGAVVNQASRLEGITKAVEIPILVSREVAERVSPLAAATMRVGRFIPAGMTVAMDIYGLMPVPHDVKRLAIFTKGLEAFERGDWEQAYLTLEELPPQDPQARYIKSLAELYRRNPPKHWTGVIELTGK